jgi:hypothetical protein
MFGQQTAALNNNVKRTNKSFENLPKLKCLDIPIRNENEERLNSVNALYYGVQNVLIFWLNIKMT